MGQLGLGYANGATAGSGFDRPLRVDTVQKAFSASAGGYHSLALSSESKKEAARLSAWWQLHSVASRFSLFSSSFSSSSKSPGSGAISYVVSARETRRSTRRSA